MKSKASRSRHDESDDIEDPPEKSPASEENNSFKGIMFDQETVATVRDMDISRTSLNDASCKFSAHSAGSATGKSRTRSIVVPLDPSVLKLVMHVDDDDDLQQKKRCCANYHIFCCRCCCDVRRASIVANSVYGVIVVLLTVFVFVAEHLGISRYDDDEFQDFVDRRTEGTVVRNSLGLVMAIGTGLYGAIYFKKWLVLAMVSWYGIYLVWAVLGARYFSGIFAGILIYPNLALFLALKNRRLTPDSYATTDLCCSCCDKNNRNNDNNNE